MFSERKMTYTLAIIPARGGSKGIPRKNIKDFAGKPLIAWSILQALSAKQVDRVIVSTDCDAIAKVAEEWGAEVPFRRPAEISGDLSTDFEFMAHALEFLREEGSDMPDLIVHLRPTFPLRSSEFIDGCVTTLRDDEAATSLRTIIPTEKSPYKMYTLGCGSKAIPLFDTVNGLTEPYNRCRQELPLTYLHNGCVDVIRRETIESGSMTGSHIHGVIMDAGAHDDLDMMHQWSVAEKKVKDQKKRMVFS